MKILLNPHHHHEHHGKKHHHKSKKNHKLMKKIAKLEKKMSKYHFDSSSSDHDTCSSDNSVIRSRSLSRSHKRRMGRYRHRRYGKRFESHGRSSSSSSSSSSSADSSDSSSSSSDSSRSPSPRHHRRHHRRHHGPPKHLSRSRSFAGRDNRSPSPHSRCQRRNEHPHPNPPHHRGRFWHHHSRRNAEGAAGFFVRIQDDESNQRDVPANTEDENQQDLMELTSPARSASREPEVQLPAPEQMDDDIQEVTVDEDTADGPEINATLAENWKKVICDGLSGEVRKSLLKKYPISKNCSLLKGPKINAEILPAATNASVKRDSLQANEQNLIGAGLTALGKAISNLDNMTEIKKDENFIDVLENLNEAAVILLDVHHKMTKTRQAFILPELNKRVRPVVEACEADEYLFGDGLGDKLKTVKYYGKNKREWKHQNRENRSRKGEKRKHIDHDGDGRKSKHLHEVGSFKKGFCHHGPKKQ